MKDESAPLHPIEKKKRMVMDQVAMAESLGSFFGEWWRMNHQDRPRIGQARPGKAQRSTGKAQVRPPRGPGEAQERPKTGTRETQKGQERHRTGPGEAQERHRTGTGRPGEAHERPRTGPGEAQDRPRARSSQHPLSHTQKEGRQHIAICCYANGVWSLWVTVAIATSVPVPSDGLCYPFLAKWSFATHVTSIPLPRIVDHSQKEREG